MANINSDKALYYQNLKNKKINVSQTPDNESDSDSSGHEGETKVKLPEDIAKYIERVNEKLMFRDSLMESSVGNNNSLKKLFHHTDDVLSSNSESQHKRSKIKEKSIHPIYNASTFKIIPFNKSVNIDFNEPSLQTTLSSSKLSFSDSKEVVPNIQIDYSHYRNFVGVVAELINKSDMTSLETLVQDSFVEDCILKNPALKEPVTGRHNIIEFFRSFTRVTSDLDITVCQRDEVELNGSIILTSNYNAIGLIFFLLYNCYTSTYFLYYNKNLATITGRDSFDHLWNDISKIY